jgi:hypothetical protein
MEVHQADVDDQIEVEIACRVVEASWAIDVHPVLVWDDWHRVVFHVKVEDHLKLVVEQRDHQLFDHSVVDHQD